MNTSRIPVPGAPALAALAVATALVVGVIAGFGPGLLTLAGSVLLSAVVLLWSSLQRLTGESPLTVEEALGFGAPSAEEERKRSIVRALKDLEYERSVGKISEEDFAELSTRYRGEAKVLLQALDTELSPLRKEAEAKLAKRLEAAGMATGPRGSTPPPEAPKEAAAEAKDGPSPAQTGAPPRERDAPDRLNCPKCETPNDADARFCKRCATALPSQGTPPG